MVQIIKSVIILLAVLGIFDAWGHSISKRMKIETPHLPIQILVGFWIIKVLEGLPNLLRVFREGLA